jgi:GT2 family glycosyltransferase
VRSDPLLLADLPPTGRPLEDWGVAAGSLRRSLKLYARGDRERARRLLIDAFVALRIAPASLPSLGEALDRLAGPPAPAAALPEPVDVIVPVHNGRAHLERLFATLLIHTEPRHRILLADDGSNDPEVAALLARAATQRSNVAVMRSPANHGFIATVNAAMRATTGHVAILNSDTEVPPGWLERLLRPILSGDRVASTTPFSNAAAIFSFPTPDEDHDLPPGLDVDAVDAAFARLGPARTAEFGAPTAIGFCMGINRAAWHDYGGFDEAAFGRGYCEETDWSLRVSRAGWSNLLVPDLFVYHTHGGTFAGRERRLLLEANLMTLYRRWPGYYRQLASFRRRDPWAGHRAAALLALAADGQARIWSGPGVRDAVEVDHAVESGHGVVTVAAPRRDGNYLVTVRRGPWQATLIGSAADLVRLRARFAPEATRAA